MPESLSLLEQYEVTRIEELTIDQRWLNAQPNKSIRSLVAGVVKSDYVSIGTYTNVCMGLMHLLEGPQAPENQNF